MMSIGKIMMHSWIVGFEPSHRIVVQRCIHREVVFFGEEASKGESQPGTSALRIGDYIVERRKPYADQVTGGDYRVPGRGPAV